MLEWLADMYKELGDRKKADELYEEIIKKYPNSNSAKGIIMQRDSEKREKESELKQKDMKKD